MRSAPLHGRRFCVLSASTFNSGVFVKRTRVHAFGLLDFRNLFATAGGENICCNRYGVCILWRDEVKLSLIEYARVGPSEHTLYAQERSRIDARLAETGKGSRYRDPHPPGRDDCEVFERDAQNSSVINPFLEVVTPDFVLFLKHTVIPSDLIVVGNCMGAGVARVRAMSPAQRSRTVVVSWVEMSPDNPYVSMGVALCCTRYTVFDRIFDLLGAQPPEVELESEEIILPAIEANSPLAK